MVTAKVRGGVMSLHGIGRCGRPVETVGPVTSRTRWPWRARVPGQGDPAVPGDRLQAGERAVARDGVVHARARRAAGLGSATHRDSAGTSGSLGRGRADAHDGNAAAGLLR